MCLWLSQYFQSWVLTLVLLSVSLCIPFWSSSSLGVLFLHLLLYPSISIHFHQCLWCYFHVAAVFLQSLLFCLWMLTSAHFSIPNSSLMSPETILTVWTNVSISLVPLPNSLMLSINIRWLILLLLSRVGTQSPFSLEPLAIGIIGTMKSSGDSEPPYKIPLLMLS